VLGSILRRDYAAGMSDPTQANESTRPVSAPFGQSPTHSGPTPSIGESLPGLATVMEMTHPIDGGRMEVRVTRLEESDVQLMAAVERLKKLGAKTSPEAAGWHQIVPEMVGRTGSLAVLHTPPESGQDRYVLTVGHACLIGEDALLTCREALEMAGRLAEIKSGQVVLLYGTMWYYFKPEQVNSASGLVLCRITGRDEDRWTQSHELFAKYGLTAFIDPPPRKPVKASTEGSMGQEIAFLHSGEAAGETLRQAALSGWQFETALISHLKKLEEGRALKRFVTCPIGSRVLHLGSPVFGRDATLLGIVSGVLSYPCDGGRRLVVNSLLGHPRFTGA
jgi:hypothetical protein